MEPLFEDNQRVVFYKSMFDYESSNVPRLEINKIYTVDNSNAHKNPLTGRIYITLKEFGSNWGYLQDQFRPICDDGYILCDYLENVDFKQYQLEEAIKQ